MINPLTEILFVKDADSFVGQRNSLKITQNTTKQICMDSLVERLFFRILILNRRKKFHRKL